MNEKPLQIEADFNGFRSLSTGGIKFSFTSLENVNPELLTQFFKLKDKRGHLLFAVRELELQDMVNIPKIETSQPKKKSKSQLLRNVFYRLWENTNKQKTFDEYYNIMMDKLINYYKDKLSEL